ncbi:MAG: putative aromatic acid transporter [Sphingomonas bacterium]|jgi:AAHS family 4-hydroxybenzoate transporter-like MFS transporter|nr:putative aromatic acid transporter [Sphingomonas bacterium]MDB5717057.1 putative aromatic acid transporter [Sphingomonas bacterium]
MTDRLFEADVRTVDVAAIIEQRRLGPFNYRLIILSLLITVFDGFDMLLISFTAPYMRDDLGLDTLMLGNVFSAGLLGMMLGGFVFSYLGDRIGRRPTVIGAAFAFGILTAATALAETYHQLLALRFLDGIAIGGMLPLAWALNIEFVPKRFRSTVVTVIMLGYTAGSTLAGPLTVWIAPSYGWEGVFLLGGVGTLACATLLLVWLPESPRFLVSKGMRPDLVVRLLKRLDPAIDVRPGDRFVLGDEPVGQYQRFRASQLFAGDLKFITPLLWLGYSASSLAIYFSASWAPIVLEAMDFPRNTAAVVASIGGLSGAALGLAVMRFTDRLGPLSIAIYAALAVPVLLMVGLTVAPMALFLPMVVLAAALIGGEHYGVLSIAGIFYPSAIRASGAGWATSVAKVGGVLGPLLGAQVLASGVPAERTYALLAVCPLIVGVCIVGIHLVIAARKRHPAPGIAAAPAIAP